MKNEIAPEQNTQVPKAYAFLSAAIFAALAIIIMQFGHLHEDAYILYIYSENLSETGVISYFLGGEPTEGATDFLWMVLIAGLNVLGVPSGLAAAMLNTAGAFICAFVFTSCASKYGGSKFILLLIAIFVPVSNLGQAAFMGFSTSFYSAMIASLLYLSVFGRGRAVLFVPVLGLIIALTRPDGAIIGGLTAITLMFTIERHIRVQYIIVGLCCAVVGVLYFYWRWSYFGQVLPLPLIVKSSSDVVAPGLGVNVRWLTTFVPFIGLTLAAYYLLSGAFMRVLAASLPIFVYFIFVSFAVQSQNVGYRFQAPLLVLMMFFSSLALSYIWGDLKKNHENRRKNTASFVAIMLPLLVGMNELRTSASMIRSAAKGQYIDVFPYYLSEHISDETVILLTEAGRLAYWMPGRKFDLVGLNTEETALNGASVEYLEKANADLIMVHQAGTLSTIECESNIDFCEINLSQLAHAFEEGGASEAQLSADRVRRAPAVTAQFLIENFDSFAVYAVKYGSAYNHIYAVRREGRLSIEAFESSLAHSFGPGAGLSYLQMASFDR